MKENPAREQILRKVRAALDRREETPPGNVPPSARVAPRQAGDVNGEIEMLLGEIAKLGGKTRRLEAEGDLETALQQLVQAEGIKRATVSCTRDLEPLGIAGRLAALAVEPVSPHADKYALAECDLGVTSVDAALPETGTLVLRSSPDRPRMVSLLPRVHLALVHPSVLCPDVGPALAGRQTNGYLLFITGPSRTSDIELTVTIGVHGPKALYVWVTGQLGNPASDSIE